MGVGVGVASRESGGGVGVGLGLGLGVGLGVGEGLGLGVGVGVGVGNGVGVGAGDSCSNTGSDEIGVGLALGATAISGVELPMNLPSRRSIATARSATTTSGSHPARPATACRDELGRRTIPVRRSRPGGCCCALAMGSAGYSRLANPAQSPRFEREVKRMSERRLLPYGSWPSPISIEMAVSSSIGLSEPRLAGSDVYWTELRPQERGRQVIVRWNEADGSVDVTPPPFNARTMAHEYGGGWYAIGANGSVYFSNLADGRIYRQPGDGDPRPLTAEGPFRYGDLVYDPARGRLLCVREDWTGVDTGQLAEEGGRIPEPRDALVAVDVTSGEVSVLSEGYDFYSTPRPSADGTQLAWLAWRHPNMPWDGTELWLASLDKSGAPGDARLIAGGSNESIVQPEWAPDGSLVFVSDRSGWWNLYRSSGGGEPRPILPMDAEFAGPQWVFGLSLVRHRGRRHDLRHGQEPRQRHPVAHPAGWQCRPDGRARHRHRPPPGGLRAAVLHRHLCHAAARGRPRRPGDWPAGGSAERVRARHRRCLRVAAGGDRVSDQ